MDKYRLRRAILMAAKTAEPAPSTAADLHGYPPIAMAAVPHEQVVDEARNLEAHGFLADLRPTRDPVWRLTAAGRDQVTGDARHDEYVWGELAL